MADVSGSQGGRDFLEPCAPCAAAAEAILRAMAEVASAPADPRLPAARRHLSAALGIVSDVADGVPAPPPGPYVPGYHSGGPGAAEAKAAAKAAAWVGRQGGPLAGLPEDFP